MKTCHPTDSGFEDSVDVCIVHACDLDDDGNCPHCAPPKSGVTNWRTLAEERRAEYIRDEYLDEEDDEP